MNISACKCFSCNLQVTPVFIFLGLISEDPSKDGFLDSNVTVRHSKNSKSPISMFEFSWIQEMWMNCKNSVCYIDGRVILTR